MRGPLPALNELRAFDAVARHSSITSASRELGLTQSAVSRQIASLETCLELRVFRRETNRLRLTDEGARYLAAIRPALAAIDSATHDARDGAALRLNVAAAPTFASQWLLPRLKRFRDEHPDLTLNFVPHTPSLDFSHPGDLDVAIQFGAGGFANVDARYLIGRNVVVICHPSRASAARRQGLRSLTRTTLLQHVEAPDAWRAWFDAQSNRDDAADLSTVDALAGPRFPQYALLLRAVAQDMGFGLVPRCLIEEALVRREVAIAFDLPLPASRGHWLCVPRDKEHLPAVSAFREWLDREVRACGVQA